VNTIILPASGQWTLPAGLEAAGSARRLAREWMGAWSSDADDTVADECLAVSELVANAAEHGAPPVTLTLSAEHRGDRIAVTTVVHDGGSQMPRVIGAGLDEERHRGLGIVAGLADKWGVREAGDGGKDVWFEITAPIGAAHSTSRGEGQ
jgi:anti-sigma regulatory factor (Ser/Thr protein kinase)